MPSADELRSRVVFSNRTAASDRLGNTQGVFVDQFAVAAKIQPRLGGETVQASRLAGRQPVSITVRQSAQTSVVTPDWQCRDARKGTRYNIRSIVDPFEHTNGANSWLELLCEAGPGVAQ